LDEKIFYIKKYFNFKDQLNAGQKITDPQYSNITIADCDRFIEKFRKAVLSLIFGLYKRRFPELSKEELEIKAIEGLKKRLTK
jgi:hypothetical protein